MNTDLTDLTAIRQRAEAATPPPWYFFHCDDEFAMNCYGVAKKPEVDAPEQQHADILAMTCYQRFRVVCTDDLKWEENARFIAHARTDIPYLLDRIEALERALVTARTAINELLIDSGLGKTALPLRSKAQAQQALTEIAGVLGAETAAATGKEAGL